MTLITGNTYPVRTELKALGGTWSKANQGWLVDDHLADEAQALVDAAPIQSRSTRRSRRGRGSSYTRFAGGAEVYRNPQGRCIDAPCCGCCS